VKKYERLGSKTKRTWDRVRWNVDEVKEMRARLTANVTMLAAFIRFSTCLIGNQVVPHILTMN